MNSPSAPQVSKASINLSFSSMVYLGLTGSVSGVLLPSFSAFYHVGDATLGLMFIVSSAGYCLSAVSSGLLVERLGLRWLLAFGWIVSILGIIGSVLQVPFTLFLGTRLLLGLGAGILETGFNIFISTQPRSPVLLNYLHAFWGVGSLIGPLIATWMLSFLWGWNSVYLLLFVLGLPALPATLWLLRIPSTAPTREVPDPDAAPRSSALRTLLTLPTLWLLIVFLLVYVGIEQSAGNWAYSYLLEDRAQGTVLAGWVVSGFWLGLTLGRFFIQRQAERMGMNNARLMALCIGAMIVGLLVIWLIPVSVFAAIGFCFLGLSLAPMFPLSVAIIPRLVPAHLGASAIGLLVSLSIIGIALFPWLAGVLAQAFGVWTLLPYLLAQGIVLLGLWLFLVRPVSAAEESAPAEAVSAL